MKKLLLFALAVAGLMVAGDSADACPGFFGRCGSSYRGSCGSGSCGSYYYARPSYQSSCGSGTCGSVYYNNGVYYSNGVYYRSTPVQPQVQPQPQQHGGAKKVVPPAPDARPPYGGAVVEPSKVTVPEPKPQIKVLQMPAFDQVGPAVK